MHIYSFAVPNEKTYTHREPISDVTKGAQEMCEALLMPAAYPPMTSSEVPKLGGT